MYVTLGTHMFRPLCAFAAHVACAQVLGHFGATVTEPPRALYTRLRTTNRTAADAIGTYCNAVKDRILSKLAWMDYELCYTAGKRALGMGACRSTCGFCYVNPGSRRAPPAVFFAYFL